MILIAKEKRKPRIIHAKVERVFLPEGKTLQDIMLKLIVDETENTK